nr:MAG TPA: hypothetical protein [Caudoviricetes sp.]DAV19420.1 MAG TPA: hypothetical protein [Bacteriophage sp.]
MLRVCLTWHKRVSKGGCIHLKETHKNKAGWLCARQSARK